MASRPRLDGKVALVTGAASGLGLVSATRFGEEGARVVCVDIEGAGEAADRVAATGADSIAVAADVTDPGAIDGAVAATLERFGRLDVVLANAGIAGSGMAHATTPEQWERVIGVNLTGVFLTIRAVLPQLMERRAGSVVATSSLARSPACRARPPTPPSSSGPTSRSAVTCRRCSPRERGTYRSAGSASRLTWPTSRSSSRATSRHG
jgi:NAD(P)-dependent dehydrogenase (short-subunit alcohol dehydrogenase family)